MIKKLLLLPFSALTFAQGISIDNTNYTPQQMVTDVLLGGNIAATNITSTSVCGIGYFNANGSDFPFAEGIVLRNGNVNWLAGQYSDNNTSGVCSGNGDPQVQAVSLAAGQPNSINDVTSIKFDFVPQSGTLSFNFIFASNEYGTYQCGYGDIIAFLLEDLTTGDVHNLALIPSTTTPVTVTTVRNNEYNPACPSVNASYFDSYNVTNPAASNINMRGQTHPMTAIAEVTPGNPYSLKFAVGDYMDSAFDSAIFIEAGSVNLANQSFATSPVRIYPNPAESIVNIASPIEMNSVKIIDLLGKVILSTNSGGLETRVDISGIRSGVYAIEIATADGKKQTKKLIIRN